MEAANIPTRIPTPWGSSAPSDAITVIPTTTAVPGRASWTIGFSETNFTPIPNGGIPPFGQDENGALNAISAWAQWVGIGGRVGWDSATSSNIGGYPLGALLQVAGSPGVFWVSTTENNTTDPDAGGAGWLQSPAPQGYYQATGTANAITVITPILPSDLGGLSFLIRAANTNTSTVTLNSTALNRSDGNPMQAGDILSGSTFAVVYDDTSSAWRSVGPVVSQFAGGGLMSTGGKLAVNIDGLTAKTVPAVGDEVMIWDVTSSGYKKTTVDGIAGTAGSSTEIFALSYFMGMMG